MKKELQLIQYNKAWKRKWLPGLVSGSHQTMKKVGTNNGSNDNYEGSKVIKQNTLLSKVFYYIIPIYKITQK